MVSRGGGWCQTLPYEVGFQSDYKPLKAHFIRKRLIPPPRLWKPIHREKFQKIQVKKIQKKFFQRKSFKSGFKKFYSLSDYKPLKAHFIRKRLTPPAASGNQYIARNFKNYIWKKFRKKFFKENRSKSGFKNFYSLSDYNPLKAHFIRKRLIPPPASGNQYMARNFKNTTKKFAKKNFFKRKSFKKWV